MQSGRYTVANLLHRLSVTPDPWQDVRKAARRLPG
jgi:hypothetical protein